MEQFKRGVCVIKKIIIVSSLFNLMTLMVLCSDPVALHNQRISMNVDSVEKLASMYPKTVQEIQEWCDAGIKLAQQEMDELLSVSNRTFDNTVRALDISKAKLTHLTAIFTLLSFLSPDQEIRDATRRAMTQIEEFSVDLYMNPILYQVLQTYYDERSAQETLTDENILLLTDWLDLCKRKGLHLPEHILQDVKQLCKQIDKMQQDFLTNISSDVRTLPVCCDDLQGLSDSVINRLARDGDLYLLSSDNPTFRAVLEQCHSAKTRKDMFLMCNNCAYPQNDILLTQLLEKRDELAVLLGYEHFAAMDLSTTSAKTGDVVEQFLTDLAAKAFVKAQQEIDQLKTDLPAGVELQPDGTLSAWDYLYIVNQYKKKHFDIDEELIAQYLPTHKVVDGILAIYQEFLGLTFKQVQPVWAWHEDVQLIEIYRESTAEMLGYLYLDLYPREGKYRHTGCMLPQKASYKVYGKSTTTIAAIITNFPPPSGDQAALLTHDAVVTFFHEFGHAMHQVLGRTEHAEYSGASVKPDFVETPSQMFEQWMLEPAMLAKVSGHFITGEPLPARLIEQKIQLQNFSEGYQVLRQCMIALFALQLMQHGDLSYQPSMLWKELFQQNIAQFISYVEQSHWYATFGHLSAADLYASKYYSYLWTLVFACDLFTEIKKHDFNDEYRAKTVQLLSAGGSVNPSILLHDFLGRQPNQEAFLQMLGLN